MTNAPIPWQLIRRGEESKALNQLREAYALERTHPNVLLLGLTYLFLEDYTAAWEHFDDANRQSPRKHAYYYSLAGVAKWCVGQHSDAVAQWRVGCKCVYSDGAGGVDPRLLLFTASVIDPSSFERNEAVALLDKCSKSGWYRNWPGPVADYVLGRIDDDGLRSECTRFKDNERGMFAARWEIGFYTGIVGLDRGNRDRYEENMREACAITDDDFDPTKKRYASKVVKPEFYLARHVASAFGPGKMK